VWHKILVKLGVKPEEDGPILVVETQYDDAITVAAVVATAEVVGVSVDDALRVFGGFFVKAVHAGDHNRL
jgi:hypothetical protein